MSDLPTQWTRVDEHGDKRVSAIPWRPKDPQRPVVGYAYEMRTYFDAVVARYCEIAGIERSALRAAQTPFIDESKDPSGVIHASADPEPDLG